MKKRTKTTIILFAIFGIGFGVYFGLTGDPKARELRDMGVRAVFEDEEKFAQELQKDGLLYAYGKLSGGLKKEELDLSSLEYRGEDREQALKKALEGVPDVIMGAKFMSFQAFYKREERYIQNSEERERMGGDYEIVEVLDPDVHDVLRIDSPEVRFLGQDIETPEFFFSLSDYRKGYWDERIKKRKYAIFSEFIPATGIEGLLELEIKDGNILTQKTKFYPDGNGFNDFFAVRELAGESNFFHMLFGSILFMAMLCGITVWIQNRFFD